MISIWRIRLWIDYLERENEYPLGEVLHDATPLPGEAEELLDILKISRYKELGLSLKDLHLILRHITESLSFDEITILKYPGKIYSIPGNNNYLEFTTNLSAAKKYARRGYDVYMLPNPNGGKTPDFILFKNGKYFAYELKTIYSAASIITRLETAFQQSDRIMLDMVATTSSRYLAESISYFLRTHSEVKDIMIFKGEKELHVSPQMAGKKSFIVDFMIRWDR